MEVKIEMFGILVRGHLLLCKGAASIQLQFGLCSNLIWKEIKQNKIDN